MIHKVHDQPNNTMKDGVLFIVGNGFDLHHGLKTHYSDFHRFIIDNGNDLANDMKNYFSFSIGIDYLWRSFEADLRTFDYKSFLEENNNIDVDHESFRLSELYSLEDTMNEEGDNLVGRIRETFTNWVESLEYPEASKIRSKTLFLPEDELYICFNYTETLELIYGIPRKNILYIHNVVNDGDLIFGHCQKVEGNPAMEEIDENGDSNRTPFTDSESAARFPFYAFQKNTTEILKENDSFFQKIKNVSTIVVLGHSFGEVDLPYFHEIKSKAPNAHWKITYYTEDEKNSFEKLAKNTLGVVNVELVRMEEFRAT